MRLPLSVYRSRIGVQWADPSVRPSCVVTPRYSRWFMDGRFAPLSHPRKGWDLKMYPLTLSRHESERATLWLSCPWRVGLWGVCNTPLPCWKEERSTFRLSRPWRGGRGGVCNTPLPCWKEERTILWLSCPWRGGLGGVCNTPLPIRKEERTILELSRSWRGGRGADIFATCPYSFLVTITPRLTFHF